MAFLKGISRNVLILGFVSFLTDISSEMIFPLLPIFLTSILRAPVAVVGLVEGVADATASLSKFFSGWVSDKLGKRKPIVIFGYSLSAISKPLFALATIWQHVLLLRFTERLGKGIRTSARDAIVAESAIEERRGAAFGLHRSLDSAGAVLGPLIASALLAFLGTVDPSSTFRTIFLLSFLPALLAVLLLHFVKEKERKAERISSGMLPEKWDAGFKKLLLISLIFSLGNFSFAFLLLRAQELGLAIMLIPLTYLLFQLFQMLSSLPSGLLSDKIGRRNVLAFGYALFGLTCLGFGLANSGAQVWLLFPLYGIFIGIFETMSRAYVSDLVEEKVRATALGLYQAAMGFAAFPSSILAGFLWEIQILGMHATFLFGGALALISAVLLLIIMKK